VPLDFSIVLDAVPGEERIAVLTCDRALSVDGYARELASGAAAAPAGCSADVLVLAKRGP